MSILEDALKFLESNVDFESALSEVRQEYREKFFKGVFITQGKTIVDQVYVAGRVSNIQNIRQKLTSPIQDFLMTYNKEGNIELTQKNTTCCFL